MTAAAALAALPGFTVNEPSLANISSRPTSYHVMTVSEALAVFSGDSINLQHNANMWSADEPQTENEQLREETCMVRISEQRLANLNKDNQNYCENSST